MMDTIKRGTNKWFTFTLVVFGSICVAIAMFKISGTMSFIIADWEVDVSTASLLVSVKSFATLLIALPAGAIVRKIGARNSFLLILAVDAIANAIGAVAPNFTLLLVSRFIEGLASGMVFVVPPVILADAFPAEKRGLPMSLWAIWSSAGALLILYINNLVTPLYGWQANWWASAILLAIAFVLCLFFLWVPENSDKQNAQAPQGKKTKKQGAWSEALKSPACLCICVVFFAGIFGSSAYATYFPTFLKNVYGISPADANIYSTYYNYLCILVALTFGFVLYRVANKNHPKLFVVAVLFCLVGAGFMWTMPNIPLAVAFSLLAAIGMSCGGPLAHNLIPDTLSPNAMPIGMGMLSFASGVAGIVSPTICGGVVDATGDWALLFVPNVIVALIGLVAAIVVMVVLKKRAQAKVAD